MCLNKINIGILNIFVFVMFFSCKQETDTVTDKYIGQLEIENKRLKNEVEELKSELIAIKVKNEKADIEIERNNEISLEFKRRFLTTDYVQIVKDKELSPDLFLNKEKLLTFLFNFLNLGQQSILGTFLSEDIFWSNKNRLASGDLDSTKSIYQFNYLWNNIDRSPENLENLISEDDKQFLYSLFKNNNLYKKSGVQSLVEGLLLSYDELNNSDYLLERFQNFPQDIDYQYEIVVDAYTPEMKKVLADYNYSFYGEPTDIDQRLYYVYSFWARRFKEGNSEIVHQMLQEFHKNVVKEYN